MNKIIEYMAFGKPIVAFDLAEHRRSAGKAAVYVAPNDDTKFGDAIHELLLDEKARQAMGHYGQHRFCECLAWENSEQQLIGMYQQLLGTDGVKDVRPQRSVENNELVDTKSTAAVSAARPN